jgi:hypothetical protein
MIIKRMIEVDEEYFNSIQNDSYMLQCLDACGAPSLPVWEEAQALFDKESVVLDGNDDVKDVGYDY